MPVRRQYQNKWREGGDIFSVQILQKKAIHIHREKFVRILTIVLSQYNSAISSSHSRELKHLPNLASASSLRRIKRWINGKAETDILKML